MYGSYYRKGGSALAVIAVLLGVLLVIPFSSEAYFQTSYYSQSYYQSYYQGYYQGTYYSQTSYYTQGSYYSEAGYYSQGAYLPPQAGNSFSFEYELSGRCVRVTVEKENTEPFTTIRSRGYSVGCAAITSSPRALERAVELQY